MNASPLDSLGGPDGGGQSVLVDGLARGLAALGHRLTIYVRRDDPSLPAQLSAAANITIVVLDAGPRLRMAARELGPWVEEFSAGLGDRWRSDRPEIVHSFGSISGKAALRAACADGLPVVHTFGRLIRTEHRRDDFFAEQVSLVRGVARAVATSSSQVFALLGLGASPTAIKFVPCGVDLDAFAPGRRTKRSGADAFRIATLGGLGASAGIDDVIEALAFAPGVELVVGGGRQSAEHRTADADAARLFALAQSRFVADRVRFAGHVQRRDVAAFLRAADVVICPPHDESTGTAALEAMACGVPLIVSAVGGLVDAVVDGMTGIHVPPRAPRQLAYAIEAMRVNEPLRERFGRLGAERTKARYGWSRIAAETFEIYRSVATHNSHLIQRQA